MKNLFNLKERSVIMRRHVKSFKELMEENRQELLKDKQLIEKIEKRLEKRHGGKKLA
jgi:diadenosine tetraphosphate (Ap4A) HIT family hydrolase